MSDDEDDAPDNALLARLIKDVSEVDFDDVDLGTKICDLMVPGRKTKSTSRDRKSRKGDSKNINKVFP